MALKFRKSFGHSYLDLKLPDLMSMQFESYKDFIQADVAPSARKNKGLQAVFNSVFPIADNNGAAELAFVEYKLEEPVYTIEECIARNLTYAARMKLKLRMTLWDIDPDTGKKALRDIKDQEVFMGDLPMMTETGTFIFNGAERVIVSQIHRSRGVVFGEDEGTGTLSDRKVHTARIIPERGSWIDMDEIRNVIYARIDRRRKILMTTFLRCLPTKEDEQKFIDDPKDSTIRGMTDQEILGIYYKPIELRVSTDRFIGDFENLKNLNQFRLNFDLLDTKSGKAVATKTENLNVRKIAKLQQISKEFAIAKDSLVGEYIFDPIMKGEEVLYPAATEITEVVMKDIMKLGIQKLSIISVDRFYYGAHLRNTLAEDKNATRDAALIDIYNVMRPGERPTVDAAAGLFSHYGFDKNYYDLSEVGRFKMNSRLKVAEPADLEKERLLTKTDFVRIVGMLCAITDGKDKIDDVDHLSNRRVRTVGELMGDQIRIGMTRIERFVRDQLASANIASSTPQDIINARQLVAAISEFFGSSPLSQLLEQTNPLAEIEHKRLVSALGPDGLNRERAGLDVRDVHPTYYGRICPIQAPEGQNIGLINHFSVYARVNKYGFVETPYYIVKGGVVTDELIYLTADEEAKHKIAQGNSKLDEKRRLVDDNLIARVDEEFTMVPRDEIDLIDVSTKQVISLATGLIPFLENDDANRALMGSNMMKQGVPLVRSDAPLIGTGIESVIARDSKSVEIAKHSGVVELVDAERIVVKCMNSRNVVSGVDIYNLKKFQRSNSDKLMHQKPLVKIGDRVNAGDVIADGSCTEHGELALGRNVVVAFMPWRGYNYEDSIVISEKISREDTFTSIKIFKKEVRAKDTQLGQESFTRDIPNVGEHALRNLDESGIIYVGAHVKPGDILVGKVSPKAESSPTPEEDLLRAIFGEKALNVRDTSLRMAAGEEGVVVGVDVLTRHGVPKDERTQMIEMQKISKVNKDREDEREILEKGYYAQVYPLVEGKILVSGAGSLKQHMGRKLTQGVLESLRLGDIKKIAVKDPEAQAKVDVIKEQHNAALKALDERSDAMVKKIQEGNSLTAGVLKEVKVYIAHKMKLQPGDKMAGRHGNKGIVSSIVPVESMPHLSDGTPVDIVLNPLGVPSRMNIGQILETHLGFASRGLGQQIDDMLNKIKAKKATADDLRVKLRKAYDDKGIAAQFEKMNQGEILAQGELLRKGIPMSSPSFDGALPEEIHKALEQAGLPKSGQVDLYDGMTGDKFARPVTVGVIYMMKLKHLVDEKIHARSTGHYTLITQQPLSGRANMGGQRFGEMETWALEAHGAAHILKEMLTVKSDDITGRNKMYEAVISGSTDIKTGIPEGFNVLTRELRAIGLNLSMKSREKVKEEEAAEANE
ncbi:MAG: DNA-directed RNA polymerase subunit beta [Rickettsiales bacterium]|jgi:DNA-directed RNA polymerase subunit beta|nr:DNA-directed RNA polymerase subunit beta [Rickettsiales bacterium]